MPCSSRLTHQSLTVPCNDHSLSLREKNCCFSCTRLELESWDLKGVPKNFVKCTGDQAVRRARMLASEEGIFGGYSTAAHLHAAIDLLQSTEQGNTIAFLVCDTGMKYLCTDLYP
jgi:threonine synthase